MYPKEYRYTKKHEWILVDGDTGLVGITDHAQEQLGDVVYVELPKIGAKLQAMQSFGTIESVKAVSDLYSPMSGEVTEINDALVDAPETLNKSPHTEGWLVRLKLSDKSESEKLLSADEYQQFLASESES
ncbi:MAG: glycine cleavage system protein GcvH [Bryobacterales bacterium]